APAQLVLPAALPRWYSAELASSRQAEMDANGEVNLRTVENWQGYLNKITRESYEPVGRATLKNTLPRLILSASADAELSEFGSNARQEIFEYMLSETRRLVTTDADISAQFPTFVEGLRGKGLYKLIELTQSAYDER
ncbi:MAG: hypothetical protein LBC78_01570, partial [Oscillospiraceae bacterium]|nr:hypothetical protein [Oscillospiraceae bacterium]